MGNYAAECLKSKDSNSISSPKASIQQLPFTSSRKPTVRLSNQEPSKTQPNQVHHYKPLRFLEAGYSSATAIVQNKNREDDTQYVLKIIDKQKMKKTFCIQNFQVNQYLKYKSSFLTEIYFVTQNKKKILLLMEYVEPGDLLYYIRKEKGFDEQVIRHVIAEILQPLKLFSKRKLIFGRLKPENILVLTSGHVQLSDYQFVQENQEYALSENYRGALQYAAPQVFNNRGLNLSNLVYNSKVDMWALGILIYEMKHSCTPFNQYREEKLTKNAIRQGLFNVDSNCSDQFKDLIKKLISSNPDDRLEIEEIEFHPFFKNIDWNQIRQRKNPTPMQDIVSRLNTTFQKQKYIRKKRMFLSEPDSDDSDYNQEIYLTVKEHSTKSGKNTGIVKQQSRRQYRK